MRNALRRLYNAGPGPLQSLVRIANGLTPDRFRFGPRYEHFVEWVKETEHWPEDAWRPFQIERLQALLEFAAQHVPYYRDLFGSAGAPQIRDLADLAAVPTLNRAQLRESQEELRADAEHRPPSELCHTGGSTGAPASFYVDKEAIALEKALLLRHRMRAGFRPGDRHVQLRGLATASVLPGGHSHWLYVPGDRELILSSIELSRDNVHLYLRKLERVGATLLNGYPSASVTLARLARERGLEIPSFRGIVTASEPLSESQREEIEAAYQAPVFHHYGLSENAISAGECEARSGYHVNFEQGVLELVDPESGPREDGLKEIVATSLWNRSQLLLRYRTGDLAPAELISEACSCGRTSPRIASILGRLKDTLVTAGGGSLSPAGLSFHGGYFSQILHYQFVQQRPGEATLAVVPIGELSADQWKGVEKEARSKLPEGFELTIEVREEPYRTKRNKIPMIIQNFDSE